MPQQKRTVVRRCWEFWLAPFVERYIGLSLVRFLAIAAAACSVYVVWQTKAIAANAVWLFVVAIATGFGKHVFTRLVDRMDFHASVTQADVHTVAEATRRIIMERRDHDQGPYEPTLE